MTNPTPDTLPTIDNIDDILQSFAGYCRHHERTGMSTGHGLNKPEAKAQLEQLMARERIEAYKTGLLTGAMPEFIGKPMVLEYLAARPQPLNNKGEK